MRYLMSIALAAVSCSLAAQTLDVAPIEAEAGTRTELVINAHGLEGMTTLQFNIALPKNVSVITTDATLGSATNGHKLCIETLTSGDLMFVLYSMDLNTFSDGELLRLPITVSSELFDGTTRFYTIHSSSEQAVSTTAEDVITGLPDLKRASEGNAPLRIYNVSGQRIAKPQQGLNIIDGKKVIMK